MFNNEIYRLPSKPKPFAQRAINLNMQFLILPAAIQVRCIWIEASKIEYQEMKVTGRHPRP
jgi:hypothetical protein